MALRAISVDEDRGFYQFALGARAVPLANLLVDEYGDVPVRRVEVLDGPLMGWDGWEWAVEIERDEYSIATLFVGRTNPETDVWPPMIQAAIDAT